MEANGSGGCAATASLTQRGAGTENGAWGRSRGAIEASPLLDGLPRHPGDGRDDPDELELLPFDDDP